LTSKASIDVSIRAVFTHIISPFPASITQSEKQLVRYADNHYFYTPYPTTTQTTTVKLSSGNIESKTEKSPTSVKGDTITYGPYTDVSAFSSSTLNIHYENNKPFLTATKLVKELEISHWGNLAVEVTYDVLRDDGAALKGTFSRYDYQRNPSASPAVVPVFKTVLPPAAADVYYRDEIGNITTSNMNINQRGLVLDLIPRFPLFGGWKTAFYMGYNLPLHQFLFTSSSTGRFVLNTTFAVTIDDVVVDDYTVRVILPEGSKDIQVQTPFSVDSQSSATHFTYLDTSGRPVLVLNKKNVISEHDKYFQVSYTFTSFSLFSEPILLIGAYFAFFVFVMLYVRLNLGIGPTKVRNPNADRLDDVLTRFRDLMDQRTDQISTLESNLAKVWKAKSDSIYNQEKKKIEQTLNLIKKEVQKVISELEEFEGETARQIKDLEKKFERKLITVDQLHINEINFKLHKKISKSAFEDSKVELEKSYNNIDDDIGGTVGDLTEHL